MLSTQIEINAAPEAVRAKFLDFAQLKNYHNGFFVALGPAETCAKRPDGQPKTGLELEVGDKMRIVVQGMTIGPTVTENSPEVFQWVGGVSGVFRGSHFFRFTPSKTTPNGTTFIHGESFSGILAFCIGENWIANRIGFRAKTERGFEGFNKDLKAWCEKEDKQ